MWLKRLTEKQRKTFVTILNFKAEYGRNASLRELALILGITVVPLNSRVQYLVKKGYLTNDDGVYNPTREGILQCREDGDRPYRIKKSY